MFTPQVIVVLIGIAAAVAILVRFAYEYFHLRGKRVVTCPETAHPVGVSLQAGKAALSATFGQPSSFGLAECSRWPERAGCDQGCVRQIETSPDGTLVRNMLARWFEGKRCVFCKGSIPKTDLLENKPALVSPEGLIVDWESVEPSFLSAMMKSHKAACFRCSLTESFRHDHPELVTNREQTPLRSL